SKLPGALGGKSLDKDARAFEIAPSRGKSRGLGSKGRILRVTLEGKLERGIGALKCTHGLGDAVEQQRFDGAAAAFGERDGEDPFPRLGGAPRAILGMDARKLTEKDIEGRGGLDFILERFAKTKERGDGRRTGRLVDGLFAQDRPRVSLLTADEEREGVFDARQPHRASLRSKSGLEIRQPIDGRDLLEPTKEIGRTWVERGRGKRERVGFGSDARIHIVGRRGERLPKRRLDERDERAQLIARSLPEIEQGNGFTECKIGT